MPKTEIFAIILLIASLLTFQLYLFDPDNEVYIGSGVISGILLRLSFMPAFSSPTDSGPLFRVGEDNCR